MDMRAFSEENLKRCQSPRGFNHKLMDWSLSDWMTATLGELGEAANVLKKLNRVRDGIPGNKQSPDQLQHMFADELADTYIYLDLMAQAADVDLLVEAPPVFHEEGDKNLSNWMTATLGALGMAAILLNSPHNYQASLQWRLRDVRDYLYLMAQAAGIDLPQAILRKFESKSEEIGYDG